MSYWPFSKGKYVKFCKNCHCEDTIKFVSVEHNDGWVRTLHNCVACGTPHVEWRKDDGD